MKFRTILVAALATGLAVPALAAPAPTPPAADPAKQALAVRVAASLWPDGTYGRLVETMFVGKDGLTDMVFDMRPADLMVTMAQAFAEDGKPAAKPKRPAEPPSPTIREMMIAKDPHFEERTRITMKVVGEEVRRIATPIEPRFREGLAKSIARRFTSEQLGPIATFLDRAGARLCGAVDDLVHRQGRDAGAGPLGAGDGQGNARGDGEGRKGDRAFAQAAQGQAGGARP